MTARTRFAPSPTGYLHIGGARTALFCYAFARRRGGVFAVRIEDTDAARSTADSAREVADALRWLNLRADEEIVYSSHNRARHREAIEQLLDQGQAYRCYATPAELAAMREAQAARGEKPKYDRRWRDAKRPPPKGVKPAIRFKTPRAGDCAFDDAVYGRMSVANAELDDLVVARADGAPTYNLAVVADDIAMKITDVVRGSDHINNTFRQLHIFRALGAAAPNFAHLPLLFNAARDRRGELLKDAGGEIRYEKMSKRNSAVDVMHYRSEGFLPDALVNYLSRLGYAVGDEEIYDLDFFIRNFDIGRVHRAPARFDLDKLRWVNQQYLSRLSPARARALMAAETAAAGALSDAAVALYQPRAATLRELRECTSFFAARPPPDRSLLNQYLPAANRAAFADFIAALRALPRWEAAAIKNALKQSAARRKLKFPALAMPLRILLTARAESPDIAAIAAILGKDETLARTAIDG